MSAITFLMATLVASLVPFPAQPADAAVFAFEPGKIISGINVNNPTAIDWGPDNRLYVMQQNGMIKVYNVNKSGNNYSATEASSRSTNLINTIPNHNDNGSNAANPGRLSTGMIVAGSSGTPVIYATSSDPRISSDHENVDTNSGVVSKLTWNGSGYSHQKLVQGLPRSKENHGPNGLHLDESSNTLYIAQGGNTNAGGPSPAFIEVPEYAYSAAILSIDLDAIGSGTCNLPTLDSGNNNCLNNPAPWGGEDGDNMAKLMNGVPVQVHAPGFRNPYDVIITGAGEMYTIDNGLNQFFGDVPVGMNTPNCNNDPVSNNVSLSPSSRPDHLERIPSAGYYGGHPNPTRGNPSGSGFPGAVPSANPVECDGIFPVLVSNPSALATFSWSTNSIDEYTAGTVFGGGMVGDLVAVEFSYTSSETNLLRIDINGAGTNVGADGVQTIAQPGQGPLGVVALGDTEKFPGSILVANYGDDDILVFDPDSDFTCSGANNPNLDEDNDGYDNADEIAAGSSPCNAGDKPHDWDNDKTSDVTDKDDDNDGVFDVNDPFAIDGAVNPDTTVPIVYEWENDSPEGGGLLGIGFTGMMTNGSTDYLDQYDSTKMTVVGAAGVVVVDEVTSGDALGSRDDQEYAFQFGVDVPSGSFSAHTSLVSPFDGINPQDHQSQGLYIGTGNQNNYLKVVAEPDGISVLKEVSGSPTPIATTNVDLPGPATVDLWIAVDPDAERAQAFYSVNGGSRKKVGGEVSLPSSWLSEQLAVGIISTSRGAPSFGASWDFFEVTNDSWTAATPPGGGGAGGGGGGFTDIAGSTFITEINWLAAEGITKGCNPPANDEFCPKDFVTRGQMAAFLHRALDDILSPGSPVEFIDDNGNTFENDIEWLGATGITKGCNPPANDRFCPNDFVTREQMAAFLFRALG